VSSKDKEADASGIKDELPEDLDITKYVGPYQFPTPRRRRTASYSVAAISALIVVMAVRSSNGALLVAGIVGLVIAAIFYFLAWPLNISDIDALTLAASQAPFAVGHASAQLSFYGWSSKPTWRVVVFSSDDPPSERGLVEINAVSKEVISTYFDEEEQHA